jgi:type III pantothenate kinase
MFLAIDVGNTETVFGVSDETGAWKVRWRLSTIRSTLGADWAPAISSLADRDKVDLARVRAACMSSVVPAATQGLSAYAREWLAIEPLIVGAELALNFALGVHNPGEVGADRIANAASAWDMCRAACIVVDLGTATKVEAINDEGVFLGGAIAPGIGTSMDALASRAARLFNVQLTTPDAAIGKDTVTALRAGLVLGHQHMISGLIGDFRRSLGVGTPVLVTGGYATLEDLPFRSLGQYEPDLTLNGIRLIHHLNTTQVNAP